MTREEVQAVLGAAWVGAFNNLTRLQEQGVQALAHVAAVLERYNLKIGADADGRMRLEDHHGRAVVDVEPEFDEDGTPPVAH